MTERQSLYHQWGKLLVPWLDAIFGSISLCNIAVGTPCQLVEDAH
jgi:hypothetical protein